MFERVYVLYCSMLNVHMYYIDSCSQVVSNQSLNPAIFKKCLPNPNAFPFSYLYQALAAHHLPAPDLVLLPRLRRAHGLPLGGARVRRGLLQEPHGGPQAGGRAGESWNAVHVVALEKKARALKAAFSSHPKKAFLLGCLHLLVSDTCAFFARS